MKVVQVYDGIYSKADGITSVIESQHDFLVELLDDGSDQSSDVLRDARRRVLLHLDAG